MLLCETMRSSFIELVRSPLFGVNTEIYAEFDTLLTCACSGKLVAAKAQSDWMLSFDKQTPLVFWSECFVFCAHLKVNGLLLHGPKAAKCSFFKNVVVACSVFGCWCLICGYEVCRSSVDGTKC